MKLSRGGREGSTDTFPFQTIMEGSWDCEALAFVHMRRCPSGITCYCQITFGHFSMTSWTLWPGT